MTLKEFYQYRRELCRYNKALFLKSLIKKKTSGVLVCPSVPMGLGMLYIKTSLNNTFITLTNSKGKVLLVRSCGCLGFLGKKKRSTKFAIESTFFQVLQKVREYGWQRIFVSLSGFGQARFYFQNCLKKANLKLSFIRDITSIPHNGCRPRKLRRG